MHAKIAHDMLVMVASFLIISVSGCASSPGAPASSAAPSGTVRLEQPAMTDYMHSRVGTPDELSPLAPAEARNVHKVGDQWVCEVHGQTMVYNNATACWQPQQK